jgi:hypothetical protein
MPTLKAERMQIRHQMKIRYCVTGGVSGGTVTHVLDLIRSDIKAGHHISVVDAPDIVAAHSTKAWRELLGRLTDSLCNGL